MITIGSRIRVLREQKGLSMKSLSEQITDSTGIKVSSGQISDWENGNKNPSADGIIALSTFFKTSTDWILTGKESTVAESNTLAEPLFFDEKREVDYHFDNLIGLLDEKDRAFIDRYIELALLQKQQQSEQTPSSLRTTTLPTIKNDIVRDLPSAIPILGRAAAGVPIEMVRFIEGYLKVPSRYKNCFAVKVDGESMVNAGIVDGGYVIVRQQERVENNEIALVKVDERVTIKRFKLSNNLAYLISENDKMEDMIYDPYAINMQILGLVVEIITPEKAKELFVEEL